MGGFCNTEVTIWNAMIRGYVYNEPIRKYISMFDEMTLRKGQRVHYQIIKFEFESAFSFGSGLFDFYVKKIDSLHMDLGKCGSLDDARTIFDGKCEKTIELWNRMIGKYVSIGDLAIVRELFDKIPERDRVKLQMLEIGLKQMPEKNVVSWTTIVGAYADVRDLKTARIFFQKMPERNVVSWNCMMSGYTKRRISGGAQSVSPNAVRRSRAGFFLLCFSFISLF
ncbi:Pentatricopeptide repeat-containing protein [Forsythia ovata]|uniref:Pentatricopeptide repeat-containing protein n=1 Tax=Forsythia ovata TaxID=205694 RepID=A0ABD1SU60_9LAMI